MKFIKGFEKVAGAVSGLWNDATKLDKAGLIALTAAPAYQTAKAIKEKNKTDAALAASEVGGLGLLYRSVLKAKH